MLYQWAYQRHGRGLIFDPTRKLSEMYEDIGRREVKIKRDPTIISK